MALWNFPLLVLNNFMIIRSIGIWKFDWEQDFDTTLKSENTGILQFNPS